MAVRHDAHAVRHATSRRAARCARGARRCGTLRTDRPLL